MKNSALRLASAAAAAALALGGCSMAVKTERIDTPSEQQQSTSPQIESEDASAAEASAKTDSSSKSESSAKEQSSSKAESDPQKPSSSRAESTAKEQPSSKSASTVNEQTKPQQDEQPESKPESKQESKPRATGISISLPSNKITAGETVTPTVTLKPENAEPEEYILTVSDSSIILINGDSTVTALGEGECALTVSLERDSSITAQTEITVTPKPDPLPTENVFIKGILLVNKEYSMTDEIDPGGLTPECAAAFDRLVSAAAESGYSLYSLSDYRSSAEQQEIYDSYVYQLGQYGADAICALPGHSEHQTGLAIDVASYSTGYFPGTPEAAWLAANCADYGFIIRYPYGKEYATGYSYEAWHIRYVGDAAREITDSGLALEEYLLD